MCASLSDMDHLRKISTEPKRVLLLDSEHKVRYNRVAELWVGSHLNLSHCCTSWIEIKSKGLAI